MVGQENWERILKVREFEHYGSSENMLFVILFVGKCAFQKDRHIFPYIGGTFSPTLGATFKGKNLPP